MKKIIILPSLFMGLSVALSCSLEKDIGSFRKKAEEMAKVSQELRDMSERNTEDARQGGTSAARDLQIKTLLDYDDVIEAKQQVTGKYFGAMEFQYWKNANADSPERRNELFEEASRQFFNDFTRFVPKKDFDNFDPTKFSDRKKMAVYAFSSSVQTINPSQRRMAERTGTYTMSFYDLLKQGLSARGLVNNGEVVEKWKYTIVKNEDAAIYLLKMRYNFVPMMIGGRLSQLDVGGTLEKLYKALMIYLLDFQHKTWKPNWSLFNAAEIEAGIELMQDVLSLREFLKSLGEKPETHCKVELIYDTMELWVPANDTPYKKSLIDQFIRLVTEYKAGNQT